jgi:hypothetical protein
VLDQFHKSLGPELISLTGDSAGIDEVMARFEGLVIPLGSVPFDIFDQHFKSNWDAVMKQFRGMCDCTVQNYTNICTEPPSPSLPFGIAETAGTGSAGTGSTVLGTGVGGSEEDPGDRGGPILLTEGEAQGTGPGNIGGSVDRIAGIVIDKIRDIDRASACISETILLTEGEAQGTGPGNNDAGSSSPTVELPAQMSGLLEEPRSSNTQQIPASSFNMSFVISSPAQLEGGGGGGASSFAIATNQSSDAPPDVPHERTNDRNQTRLSWKVRIRLARQGVLKKDTTSLRSTSVKRQLYFGLLKVGDEIYVEWHVVVISCIVCCCFVLSCLALSGLILIMIRSYLVLLQPKLVSPLSFKRDSEYIKVKFAKLFKGEALDGLT